MTMTGYSPDDDHQPLTWWRGYPINATTLLVIVHVATMIATAIAMGTGLTGLLAALTFSSNSAINGFALWQYFTYAFVNDPSIWFAVEMLMLFWFGREVEQFLRRRSFLLMYLLLLVTTPLVMTGLGFFRPTEFAGSRSLHFAVFIAFATIYPNVAVFWSVTAKWIAVILTAIYTLQSLAANDLQGLLGLWANVAFAYGYVRYERGHFRLPDLRFWKRKPRFRVVREVTARSTRVPPIPEDEADSIDPLLDKIAKSGIASLTAKERARLEKARVALIKKDRG